MSEPRPPRDEEEREAALWHLEQLRRLIDSKRPPQQRLYRNQETQ